MKRSLPYILGIFLFVFSGQLLGQQNVSFLRVSPPATVTQKIATFVEVSVNYHRPAVNNREVWGTLVPYGHAPNNFGNGKPMPWRAGANETTIISFSHDVTIEGKKLAAGTYGLHMLPTEKNVTVIFNTNSQSWGSFFYDKADDALRVTVNWQDAPHMENLLYGFENMTPKSATAFLHWGKKKIPFNIEVDRVNIVLDTYKNELTTLPGFNSAAWSRAAGFAINNSRLDLAEQWIDKALSMNGGGTFANKQTKSRLLELNGKKAEAVELANASYTGATEAEVNQYGYQIMNSGAANIQKALVIFKTNMDNFPQSWNVYDSYAEALGRSGAKKEAAKFYKKALEMAPQAQHARINSAIKAL